MQHSSMQDITQQEAACLFRAEAMPRAQAYAALCRSVTALYQQERATATSVASLARERGSLQTHVAELKGVDEAAKQEKAEVERLRAENALLREQNMQMKAQLDATVATDSRLRHHQRQQEHDAAAALAHLNTELNQAQKDASREATAVAKSRAAAAMAQGAAASSAEAAKDTAMSQKQSVDAAKRREELLLSEIRALEEGPVARVAQRHKKLLLAQVHAAGAETQGGLAGASEAEALLAQISALQDENSRLAKNCG